MKTNATKEAEMCALRDQGLTFAEIGKRMGTSHQTAQIIVSRVRRLQANKDEALQCISKFPIGDMPLREFLVANDASVRLINIMYWNSYATVSEVLEQTEKNLIRLPNMGKMSLRELVMIMERHGLALKTEEIKPEAVKIEEIQPQYPIEEMLLRDFLILSNASPRIFHPLINCKEYKTVHDLLQTTKKQILWLPHMGKKLVEELESILHRHGLQLRP